MFVMALGLFFYFFKNGHTPNVNVGFLRFNRKINNSQVKRLATVKSGS